MSLSLPHLTLTTSTSSLSPTSLVLLTISPTREIFGTRSIFLLRGSTAEWRINTNPISRTSQNAQIFGYYARRHLFELFREFFGFISRFEFEFRRCDFFLKESNFWCVRGSLTHNVAAHVPVLYPVCVPHNSNVVVSVTIHDIIFL